MFNVVKWLCVVDVQVYDLFQSNMRFFQQSALFRLFKHLELRMADQLRQVYHTQTYILHIMIRTY